MKVQEFNPQVYPFRLWVVTDVCVDELSNRFYSVGDDMELIGITKDSFSFDRFTTASTICVQEKESGWIGCAVLVHKPKLFVASVMAHEATHVCDCLCDTIGVSGFSLKDGEARAYFVEWVVKCFVESIKNK